MYLRIKLQTTTNEYIKLKENFIRKTYKKSNNTVINSIIDKTKQIVKKLKLEENLINILPLKGCYVTVQYHKKSVFPRQ